jgi:hypothetical protein
MANYSDERRPIGQYSESVRLLIADIQNNDDINVRKARAARLLELAKDSYTNTLSNRTKRELRLLALDIDPICLDNPAPDSQAPVAAQLPLEASPSWQAPSCSVGVSGAVRKPLTVQQAKIRQVPMGAPIPVQIKRTPVSKAYEQKKDPASVVLANKLEENLILSVSDGYTATCIELLNEYASKKFSSGFYPFPSNPVVEYQTNDGVLVRVLILTSATVTIHDKRYYLHFEIDGEMIKPNHSMILKNQKGIPCEIYADSENVDSGEKRCIRAIRYRDGTIIRYWLHEIGGKDIIDGAAYYKVRDNNIIQIDFNQYIKEMHRIGKKLNLG